MKIEINNQVLSDNSKQVDKNTVFVYSRMNESYIKDAQQNGCKEFLSSSSLKEYITQNFAYDFSRIKVVGITGTNGKTTTAAALYSTLLDLGYRVAFQGTRGFYINDKQLEKKSLTTPMQLTNFAHIMQALDLGCDFFIMEVSSHAIEQNRIEGIDFFLKILTNITQDHLDYHKTIENYRAVKNSFFDDTSLKLINKDEKHAHFNPKNAYTYGLENPATYKVGAYSFKDGTFVMLQKIQKMISLYSHLYGIFNIYNLAAAFGAADILTKRPHEEIALALENFGGVAGRVQVVSEEPLVVVDFAHTPDGMKQIFESFQEKNIIVVFGAGGDRDRSKRPIMGKIASQFAQHIIVTSDNPRFEDPDAIVDDIMQGITKHQGVSVQINRKAAIEKALDLWEKGSVVLVLGKGDETTQIIYDKQLPFSDSEVVLKHLKK